MNGEAELAAIDKELAAVREESERHARGCNCIFCHDRRWRKEHAGEEVRAALLSWMRDNEDVISDANGDHEPLADSILAHPILGPLLRGLP